MQNSFSAASRYTIITAAIIVIIAGLKSAAPILVPFLLAVFMALLCLPPMVWLQDRGLPSMLAITVMVAGIVAVTILLGWLIGASIDSFNQNLPAYQQKISGQWQELIAMLRSAGLSIPERFASHNLDPSSAMRLMASVLTGFGNVLADSFLILLTVVFILLEAGSFNRKLQSIVGAEVMATEFVDSLRLYMSIKTTMSAITGFIVSMLLWILGVDYPVLWGVVAFMFNYIPNIGSIIAAVPAILLALVQMDVVTALMVAAGYVATNVIVGNIVEPKFMGKGLGLSPLVVFLSLVVWGWVLGPVGMLISVPLTVAVKIALDSNENTRWVGVMLGSEAP